MRTTSLQWINLGGSWRLWGCVLLLGMMGCSAGKPANNNVPVQGKITVAGEPLKLGTIVYTPDAAAGNQSTAEARGMIGADGSYALQTGEDAGAVPGWYRVAIYATDATDSTKAPESLVASKYNSPETSGIKVEVKADAAAGAYDLDVTK